MSSRHLGRKQDARSLPGVKDAQMRLLVEAAATLIDSTDLQTVLPGILDGAHRLFTADAHAVWRYDASSSRWAIVAARGLSETYQQRSIETLNHSSAMPDRPVVFQDVAQDPLLARLQATYEAEGIRAVLALPLRIHGSISGTLVFYYRASHTFTDAEIEVATAFANLAASAIGSAELYETQTRLRIQAEETQRRLAYLAEASAVLDSSLDYETTLSNVARLALPHLADWCVVHILDEDGAVRQLALAHVDPAKVRWAQTLQERYPIDMEAPRGVPNVLRAGRSELYPEITEAMLVAGAKDAEHLEILRRLAITAGLVVPLLARGRTLGALTFISAESGRRYTEEDLALAEEVGRRAGLAVDNARLFRAAQEEIAARRQAEETLQRQAQLLDLAHDTIFTHDMQNRISFWNPAAEQMYGWSKEEAIGEVAHHLLATRFPVSYEAVQKALESSGHWEGELVHTRQDGKQIVAASRWALQRDEAGRPLNILEITRDITAQKQAAERQRFLTDLSDRIRYAPTSEEVLWTAVTGLGEYLQVDRCLYAEIGVDQDRIVIHQDYCRGVASVAGTYPMSSFGPGLIPEAQQGRTIVVMDVLSDPRTEAYYAAAYAPLGVRAYVAVPMRHQGRLISTFNVTAAAPRVWTEEEIALMETVAERTLLALDNVRLFEAEKERSAQLAHAIQEVHHRVKNSLQMVSGLLELQIEEEQGTVPVSVLRESLIQIKTIALVHDLLSRDRPMGNVNVADVLARLVDLLTPRGAPLSRVSPIHLDAEPVWLPTKAATAIALIVNELVSNALKHGRPTARKDRDAYATIQVCLSRQSPDVLLTVADSGPGFPPDFDPAIHAHIGLELVSTLVRNDLQGNIAFNNVSRSGSGSELAGGRVTILFPEQPLCE